MPGRKIPTIIAHSNIAKPKIINRSKRGKVQSEEKKNENRSENIKKKATEKE
jgi:hypothetical protein